MAAVQYFVSHLAPSLTPEERAPFSELRHDAYYEITSTSGRILCHGICYTETNWAGIIAHMTMVGREPVVLAVLNRDGTDYGTERVQTGTDEDDQPVYEIQGKAKFPRNQAAYEAFFWPTEIRYKDENGVEQTEMRSPSKHAFGGWGTL